jgi:hypothetical protein
MVSFVTFWSCSLHFGIRFHVDMLDLNMHTEHVLFMKAVNSHSTQLICKHIISKFVNYFSTNAVMRRMLLVAYK